VVKGTFPIHRAHQGFQQLIHLYFMRLVSITQPYFFEDFDVQGLIKTSLLPLR
jgi:hypothetical protein